MMRRRVLTSGIEAHNGNKKGDEEEKAQPRAPEQASYPGAQVGPCAPFGLRLPPATAKLFLFRKALVLRATTEKGKTRRNVAHVLAEETQARILIRRVSIDLGAPRLRRGPRDIVRTIETVRLYRCRRPAVREVVGETGAGPTTAAASLRRR